MKRVDNSVIKRNKENLAAMHLLLLAESTRGLVLSDVTLELVLLTLEGAPVLPPEWTTADWTQCARLANWASILSIRSLEREH